MNTCTRGRAAIEFVALQQRGSCGRENKRCDVPLAYRSGGW